MIEGVVFTAIRSYVSDRCYPNTFPQNGKGEVETIWPAIRYQVISSTNDADICGTDAVVTDNTTVQIDIVAKTQGAAVTLRDQVITAMQSTNPPCLRDIGSGFQTFDTETRTHRIVLSFTFYASTAGSP